MTAYFISGQAADHTLFENFVLPPAFAAKHIQWIEPLKEETLANYVSRLSQQIDATENFALIGVSFGGIIAIELSKILQPKITVIVSSIATRSEHPPHFKIIRFLRLHKLIPGGMYKWHNSFIDWCFGVKTQREKQLLKYYLSSASKNYMKWAIDQILSWQNDVRPPELHHIHGTSDRMFLHQFTKADTRVKGGSHFMIHSKAVEVSLILAEKLNAISS